jgi:ribosomal protein L17
MTPIDNVYTKEEVDRLITQAKEEAHEADRILMAKHNRTATIISMILGLICLALFLDGLLRILGIIPPFMDLDVSIVDEIVERVENDIMPLIQQAKGYIPRI